MKHFSDFDHKVRLVQGPAAIDAYMHCVSNALTSHSVQKKVMPWESIGDVMEVTIHS